MTDAATSIEASLLRLQQGNQRFAQGRASARDQGRSRSGSPVIGKQAPFAAILGCSDSRVPVEIIFDQGPGDLFVVRVAGNTAGPEQVGSLEYAVTELGTRVVVVLGHSQCGAVTAALHEDLDAMPNSCLKSLISGVRSSLGPLAMGPDMAPDMGSGEQREVTVEQAVHANVRATVARLRAESDAIDEMVAGGALAVVGAVYSLQTRSVTLLDSEPAP